MVYHVIDLVPCPETKPLETLPSRTCGDAPGSAVVLKVLESNRDCQGSTVYPWFLSSGLYHVMVLKGKSDILNF